jgi:hypothetical protein
MHKEPPARRIFHVNHIKLFDVNEAEKQNITVEFGVKQVTLNLDTADIVW